MDKMLLFFLCLFAVFFGQPALVLADDSLNAGFVKGIWFSKTPIFDNDKIRIYAAIQNRSGFDIIGKVEFFDNGRLINKTDFSALNGRLIEVWADWTALEGKHTIQAEIAKARKSEPGREPGLINLGPAFSSEEVIFVDRDTDRDGIGDKDDPDDDNDGLPDAQDPRPLQRDNPEQIKEEGFVHQVEEATGLVKQSQVKEIKDKASRIFQKAKERVPVWAKTIASRLDNFVDQQAEKLRKKKEQTRREIEILKREEPNKSRTLKKIQFYTLSFVSFFFSHKILLFAITLWLIYSFIRFVFRKL